MSLVDKKVKIKIDNLYKRKKELSNKFLDFLEENKNTIFTVKLDEKHPHGILYTFEENDIWLFYENDLKILD